LGELAAIAAATAGIWEVTERRRGLRLEILERLPPEVSRRDPLAQQTAFLAVK
jgi:hypothetical protein